VGIGVGLLLIAVGAILTWAVKKDLSGLDIQVVGVILMIVGLVGILLDALWWHSWRGGGYRRATYVEGDPRGRYGGWPRRRATTYVEEEAPPPGPPPGPPPP
jgi:Domain of unknown function (DUF6458)